MGDELWWTHAVSFHHDSHERGKREKASRLHLNDIHPLKWEYG